MEQNNNVNNIATFADTRTFDFMCTLHNGETSTNIKKDSIHDLVIEDTTINWYVRGYIDIVNPRGSLELSTVETDAGTRETYIFRNDCTDFLFIRMCPNLAGHQDEFETLHDDFYVMQYELAVYSVKDVTPPGEKQDKIKRLYFVDYRYLPFSKHNSTYTTSDYLTGAVAHMSDTEREIPSGQAIKHLIEKASPTPPTFSNTWEDGYSNIHYTSPANNRYIDDLDALIDMHVSDVESGSQPCILHLDRSTGMWHLLPLSVLFDTAVQRNVNNQSVQYVPGMWQTEQFVIGREVGYEERNINLNIKNRVPLINSLYVNYNFGASSCIHNYRFVEMHGDKNQTLFNTHPVHQNNIKHKQFSINMSTTNTSSLTTHMKKQVVDNMLVDQSTIDDVPLSINVDDTRYLNETLDHLYTTGDSTHSMLAGGRNKILKKLLFQSNAIEFTVPGETTRRSTRFISIASNDTSAEMSNKNNDKIEGQYLVIGVTHRIKNNMYTNKIIGVKPYNYDHNFISDKKVIQRHTNEQS